jgi:4-hydroxythreonine-4-phosphate dehydrogenase
MKKKSLIITPGDPKGIGPEVTRKALKALKKELRNVDITIFSTKFKVEKSLTVEFAEPPTELKRKSHCGWAIVEAVKKVSGSPESSALVTGPISKVSLQKEGFSFKGHTDMLAHLTGSKTVTMVLANEIFRVALVTNHCPLKEVSGRLTTSSVTKTIEQVAEFTRVHLGKRKPRIAVLGLNPHAGEEGILGSEESSVIIPGMKKALETAKLNKKSLELTGPHSADSFFTMEKIRVEKNKGHDFIIAQYHDQGLIPVKLSDFSNGLNLTLGLPFIRTSVDHGTAFDIAGKNKADPGSMIYAIRKALEYL